MTPLLLDVEGEGHQAEGSSDGLAPDAAVLSDLEGPE